MKSYMRIAECLQLNNGACSLSEDNDGNTVFHEAARNNVDDVLDILIENKGTSKHRHFLQLYLLTPNPKDYIIQCKNEWNIRFSFLITY